MHSVREVAGKLDLSIQQTSKYFNKDEFKKYVKKKKGVRHISEEGLSVLLNSRNSVDSVDNQSLIDTINNLNNQLKSRDSEIRELSIEKNYLSEHVKVIVSDNEAFKTELINKEHSIKLIENKEQKQSEEVMRLKLELEQERNKSWWQKMFDKK